MKTKNLIFIFAIFIFVGNAEASYTCTGKIDKINQAYNGTISLISSALYGDGTGRKICNLTTAWNGVSPETCKGWLSKLLSVEARGADITIQYNDSNTSCSAQGTWSAATNPWALW